MKGNKQLKLALIAIALIGFCLIVFLGGILIILAARDKKSVNSYEECVKETGVILESFPPQCIYNGKNFTQKLSPEDEDKLRIVPKNNAISLIKTKHPELSNYPSDSLPPKSIRTEFNNQTWYIAFVQEGSGLPILSVKCFIVTPDSNVIDNGSFDANGKVITDFSIKTCK